jgi:acyl carrier protein
MVSISPIVNARACEFPILGNHRTSKLAEASARIHSLFLKKQNTNLAKHSGLYSKVKGWTMGVRLLRTCDASSLWGRLCSMAERFIAEVREFISENFLFRADAELDNDQSLLESGVIDSTGVLEVIAFLEQTYGISVADEEIIPENLDSISNMTRYLAAKLPVATA